MSDTAMAFIGWGLAGGLLGWFVLYPIIFKS